MNKNAIKNYAVWARTELMKQVAQKAYEYCVTESSLPDYNTDKVNGILLSSVEKKQLNKLIREVKKNGYEHVIEEVAYTWFNRFIALRYMEVNNYLPQRIRVFTNDNNEFKPDLLTDAIHVELDGLDKQKVFDYIEKNKQEELYKYLLLTLCNDMNQYLPDMFTSIKDYKTLLFPDNLLKDDSVLAKLITDIDEDSWTDQVQIIGWLYQYYNSELKDFVMKKKNYTKDDIPAATQLFTPDWIVRYMTENSLGRLWVDGHPNFDHSDWKYYLEEAEQEPEVIEQLNKIKEEHAKLRPEEIKVIDPCMGSGHILVYAFDVLMDIYSDAGYSDRDAAKSILENNLYGLEIDERAYHLAYFALMMKARSYNRRILNKETKFNLVEIREPIGSLKPDFEQYLDTYNDLAHYLVNVFQDAKEFGSILSLDCTVEQLDNLKNHLDELKEDSINKDLVAQSEISELNDLLKPLIKQAKLLVQKYDVVITNPPYMGSSGMSIKLSDYVKRDYPDSKSDLFAVFIERCGQMTKKNGYQAMITQHAWMFLASYENMRKKISKKAIINMAHLGARAFEEIGGEIVQTTSFVIGNTFLNNYLGTYCRLVDPTTQTGKEELFIKGKERYISNQLRFQKIPGEPIAYWISDQFANCYDNELLEKVAFSDGQILTGNNDKYLKLLWEVNAHDIESKKWALHAKGGEFRRWYGNIDTVVKFDPITIQHYKRDKIARFPKDEILFRRGITWTLVSMNPLFGVRELGENLTFNKAAATILFNDETIIDYVLGFLNSKVSQALLRIINPTMNNNIKDILNMPFIKDMNFYSQVKSLVQYNIIISKQDWDSFETSWTFKVHPLVKNHVSTISEAFSLWNSECESRFNTLKSNEEELNRIFIDIYGLQDELDPYEEDKDVTVRKADLVRDIKSFISYAVGCMFGRYSLDVEGLAYAGGDWDSSKYSTFIPDTDDIIPICDEEYFEDDIVTRFIEFVRVVYGSDTLEDNLSFIANALGGKGNPRDVLRNYFLNDFFKDHCNTYQVTGSGKRPIYWLFDSGKKNGFKALVYIHRYAPDLIARLRTGYVHPQQARYRTQVELLQSQVDDASSTSERVKLSKQLKKINEQLQELNKYEEVVHHWADKMEPMDLDDGVKVNYVKFQELLSKIK
ncbi:BREX-1 system adenine-specific DNA-methyltransferase PglX [Eubacterium sp. TM05-53]|nr:BREX-1 system adenine-specific DNA-methyltransferase PglX [Eubacterium sp. TM05-53]